MITRLWNNKFFDNDLLSLLKSQGYSLIAGVDEAGRGALAGPVFASAVIFPVNFSYKDIKDSKLLTPSKRKKLFNFIVRIAVDFSIQKVDVEEINRIGIFKATLKAMKKALESLSITPDIALIDGPFLIPEYLHPQRAVVKGDRLVPAISAASILAKVMRDEYMCSISKHYPEYEFHRHKGYGTKLHLSLINQHGACNQHRIYYKCFRKKEDEKIF